MEKNYPLEFTLENGTHVLVNKTGGNTYEFTLKPEDGPTRQFSYVDDDRPKAEKEESLDFEQIDVLRKFWLENEEVI